MLTNNYDIDEALWKKEFAAKFNNLLAAKDVSINKAATEIGVDGKTLRSYASAASVPSAIIIRKLADYFGVSTDYLVANGKTSTGFTDNTITELANVVRNIDTVVKSNEELDTVTLTIQDKILTVILSELYYSRNRSDYESVAETLANAYGRMKTYQGHLIDYATFEKLIRHKFIYHDLEDDCIPCVDENGNDCIGVDDWESYAEIGRREEEWENMTAFDRERWWTEFCQANGIK
ncbi:MAG: helix-turn-helix transcriptional regulator [Oscillospiraceae bacterium]|nr:helix-turn-helix transcriptional regulator [Oscillospiraceae bacterium]